MRRLRSFGEFKCTVLGAKALSGCGSYQVPKEVGKVGEESPTFIQPVVERKDGIQAMFARQAAKASSAPNSSQQTPSQQSSPKKLKAEPRSPSKRKRSASPVVKTGSSTKSPTSTPSKKVNAVKSEESQGKEVIDLCDDEAEAQAGREVEKINTWEDDGVDVKHGSSQPAKGEKGGDKSVSELICYVRKSLSSNVAPVDCARDASEEGEHICLIWEC